MDKFVSPKIILSGEGVLSQVTEHIKSYDASKVMIYADPGIMQAGIVEKLEYILKEGNISYDIFSEVVPEPPIKVANKAVNALRESDAELVIGIGGGSSLDIAKVAAVLKDHDGNVEDYLNLTGTKKLASKGIPKILIPTTSGTGAEVTDIAVFSLETTKDVITDPYLIADVALVDPGLTYTLPARITAATGVDALTHAVEAFVSIHASPLTDTLALDAITRISRHIRTAVWNGKNKEARRELAIGSLHAGMSFYNAGVSGVHALAYPLGGLFKIPHGESNAVLLPYIFDYIWPSCMGKMTLIATALGLQTTGMSNREASITAVKELFNIVQDVGIPTTLKEFGINEKDLENLSQDADKQTRLLARSPKPYSLDAIRMVYKNSYNGELKLGKDN